MGRKNKKNITKKAVIIMLIFIFLAVFMIYQTIMLFGYTFGMVPREKVSLYNVVNSMVNSNIAGNGEEYTVKFAALGDIYLTSKILNGSKVGNEYDFITGTEEVQQKLNDYDLVVASLATPVAGQNYGYTSGQKYNCPTDIFKILNSLNVSVLATATYHSLDKDIQGAKNTIKNIEETGIKQVGLNNSKEEGKPVIITKNNIKFGFLSYTTNSNVVLYENNDYILDIITDEDLQNDINYLKENDVDYIITYLNVRNENNKEPNGNQIQNMEKLFNAGVNVVLCTGTKVVGAETEDIISTGKNRIHVYGIYGLGDFIGEYTTEENRKNVIVDIEFKKTVYKDSKGNIKKSVKTMKVNDLLNIEVKVNNNNSTYMRLVELNK